MSDITFEGEVVTVEGNTTLLRTTDLLLDSPLRRSNAEGHRRALVHDFDDSLTVNFGGDYPGGVTLNSLRAVSGLGGDRIDVVSRVVAITGSDVSVSSPERRSNDFPLRRALVHDFSDGLTLNFNHDYPGGITLTGPVSIPDGVTVAGTNLAASLQELTVLMAALAERVAAIELAMEPV